MTQQEIKDAIRSIENKLRNVEMRMVELGTEDKKIARQREEIEIEKRKHLKEIRFHKDSIADLDLKSEEIDGKEFEFEDEKKTLKKKREQYRVELETQKEEFAQSERKRRMASY